MRVIHRSVLGLVGIASLMLGASPAEAANTTCQAGAPNCSFGSTALHAEIKERLGTEIDSGWMDKGQIKVRTRFTIDPVAGDPLLKVDMPKGATVVASWNEAGYVNLRPVTGEGAEGTADVHFTLVPSLEANIYGIGVSYNATELVNMVPGAAFNYDAKGSAPLSPWGFAGASVTTPAPALDKSTIFGLPFSTLGVPANIAEGTLSIQAATKPTFKYTTKEVRLDGVGVTTEDGVAKVPVSDADALDVVAIVNGELSFSGTLDVRPVVKVDTVAGYPTFGLVKFSFSAVSKAYSGAPAVMNFAPTTIHIPLPNVKVPATPLGMGDVRAGDQAEQTVTIDSTGEMDGVMKFESSDPQFIVPSGEVRVPSKGNYQLKVGFKPNSDGPASATITVRSNDPDAPEQTFRVAANGASLEGDGDESGPGGRNNGPVPALDPIESEGCSFAPSRAPTSAFSAIGLGLAVAMIARRRRR